MGLDHRGAHLALKRVPENRFGALSSAAVPLAES
jgi:hypothetical protein